MESGVGGKRDVFGGGFGRGVAKSQGANQVVPGAGLVG